MKWEKWAAVMTPLIAAIITLIVNTLRNVKI